MKKPGLILCGLLLCLTLGFIWGNSALPGEESAQVSGQVMQWVTSILGLFGSDPEIGMHLLRKMAHFTEFMILGLELCWLCLLLDQKGMHALTMPLLFGSLAACVDETIQLFSVGRASSLLDVWIDIGGVAVGIIALLLGYAIHKRTFKF